MNCIVITGFLESKPKVRESRGVSIAQVGLCTECALRDMDLNRHVRNDRFRIVAFHDLAERLAPLNTLDWIIVRGRLQTSFDERLDRSITEIIAWEIELRGQDREGAGERTLELPSRFEEDFEDLEALEALRFVD